MAIPTHTLPANLEALLHRLDALGVRLPNSTTRSRAAIPTGLDDIDLALPWRGLGRALVHEWLGVHEPSDTPPFPSSRSPKSRPRAAPRSAHWSPPLAIIIQIAAGAVAAAHDGPDRVIWIGRAVWPYLPALTAITPARCFFIRATTPADRLWAADVALRSRAAAAVVIDASHFDLAATRRLQLAAESGQGFALLARPPWEQQVLSAAATRWLVSCAPSSSVQRWSVDLLRCKGVQPAPRPPGARNAWVVERDHATRALRVPADILDRPGETQHPPQPRQRYG